MQNLLKIDETLIRSALSSPLYLRVLAIKKERTDVLSALAESSLPLISRAHDENVLTGVAKTTYALDVFAEKLYSLLYPQSAEKNIFIILAAVKKNHIEIFVAVVDCICH